MPGTDDRDDSSDVLLETETGYRGGPGFADSAADELTIDDRGGLLAQPGPLDADPANERAKVVVVTGVDEGRKFELTGRNVSVGRGMDNDIVLTDLAVSRRHLRIDKDGQSYFLQDQGSGNGTLLNGRDEDGRALLRHGDRIEIGNTVLRFEFPRLTLGYSAEPLKRPGQTAPPPAAPLPPRGRVPTTTPPQPMARSAPEDVATQGQRPFGPRPSEAPPVPPPGPRAEPLPPLNGGFQPIPPPAGGYSAGPPGPPPGFAAAPPPQAYQPPPGSPPYPPPQGAPPVVAYPQAPPNFASMNAVSAMRPRGEAAHSPYPDARPVAATTRALPWLWVVVGVLGAGLLGTIVFILTRPANVATPETPDVKVIAAADAGAKVPPGPPEPLVATVSPRIALLSNKVQPGDLPKEVWGTDETAVNQFVTDAPPVAPPVTGENVGTGEDLQQARVKAQELYEARSFSEASNTLKQALQGKTGPTSGKFNALARDYSSLGTLFDRGQRTSRSDPTTSYQAWAQARRIDGRLGGAHKNFIAQRQRAAAPGAAARFLAAKDYGAAREAAGMAGSDGDEVLERLEDEAAKQVNDAKKLANKGDAASKLKARSLLKKARNMVPSGSDTYQRATEILERLEGR